MSVTLVGAQHCVAPKSSVSNSLDQFPLRNNWIYPGAFTKLDRKVAEVSELTLIERFALDPSNHAATSTRSLALSPSNVKGDLDFKDPVTTPATASSTDDAKSSSSSGTPGSEDDDKTRTSLNDATLQNSETDSQKSEDEFKLDGDDKVLFDQYEQMLDKENTSLPNDEDDADEILEAGAPFALWHEEGKLYLKVSSFPKVEVDRGASLREIVNFAIATDNNARAIDSSHAERDKQNAKNARKEEVLRANQKRYKSLPVWIKNKVLLENKLKGILIVDDLNEAKTVIRWPKQDIVVYPSFKKKEIMHVLVNHATMLYRFKLPISDKPRTLAAIQKLIGLKMK